MTRTECYYELTIIVSHNGTPIHSDLKLQYFLSVPLSSLHFIFTVA